MKLNVLNTLSLDAQDAGDVVSLCTRSAKAGSTPQTAAPRHLLGVWGDADRFCGEVPDREGSSLGLEADEACDEAGITVSKPCSHNFCCSIVSFSPVYFGCHM